MARKAKYKMNKSSTITMWSILLSVLLAEQGCKSSSTKDEQIISKDVPQKTLKNTVPVENETEQSEAANCGTAAAGVCSCDEKRCACGCIKKEGKCSCGCDDKQNNGDPKCDCGDCPHKAADDCPHKVAGICPHKKTTDEFSP